MASDESNTPTTDKLKAALWLSVGRLVDAACASQELQKTSNATPQFIAALTQMVWAQIEGCVAGDLEAFARHAGRTIITGEDVLLLARRHEGLRLMLKSAQDEERAA
ncbi:MAG: hypothetical protein M1828_006655 [Chrysothrix sp. TS-e1954]|nr:MAG: hypothetical protein M1828_006655 [Chrysothrix sp. TS-e1954]